MTDKKKIRVVKDTESPTGYTIFSGDEGGVPASNYEIKLWQMYVEAVDLVHRLHAELVAAREVMEDD